MLITFEGPEGCGKTTQIPILVDELRRLGLTVYTTREPGGTEISDQIRSVIMSMKNTGMHPRTEILLFLAARAQLVEQELLPRLNRGEIILCDRYADSTLAYQGYGHGVDLPTLRSLLQFTTGGLQPDLTLLLDVDPQIGLARRQRSGGEWNRLDAFALAFHQRVRQGYLELARLDPARWQIVDASQPLEVVQSAIRRILLARLMPDSSY